jgi:hypothetical protein
VLVVLFGRGGHQLVPPQGKPPVGGRGSPLFTIAAAPCFAKCLPISFGQYQSAGRLRHECFSGGKVLKAPANVVVLIVTAARNLMICNPALAVKLVHVIKAATETAFGYHCFDNEGKFAGNRFS